VTQVIECLSSKLEALLKNPSTTKKKKKSSGALSLNLVFVGDLFFLTRHQDICLIILFFFFGAEDKPKDIAHWCATNELYSKPLNMPTSS
jgi:hypothetical protein